MTAHELLHLQDSKEIIEHLIKYEDTYNKDDFKHKLKVAIQHLNKALRRL